ncbi:MAG: hypothetical protein R3261_08105, partial [Alphaproteobacteria bacterium]|nr:hypothetical protein [Alphaproteobacteria bacterium]
MGSYRGCLLARSSPSVTPRYGVARLFMWRDHRERKLSPSTLEQNLDSVAGLFMGRDGCALKRPPTTPLMQWRSCGRRCGL